MSRYMEGKKAHMPILMTEDSDIGAEEAPKPFLNQEETKSKTKSKTGSPKETFAVQAIASRHRPNFPS